MLNDKKIGIIAVTKKGVELGEKIKKKMTNFATLYTILKYKTENTLVIEKSINDTLGNIFGNYDIFIFITATGIAVRSIAPFIKSKDVDPGVLVIDEEGQFVIPILSGHLGGANEAANEIADLIKGVPIITTASDVSGKIAVDTLAQKIKGRLDSLESAKKVTSLIVAGEKIQIKLPKNLENSNPSGIIVMSNRKNIEVSKIIPANIVIGVGCKKDTPKEDILAAINDSMDKLNLDMKSIRCLATVDIKENEEGLIEAAKELDQDLKIIKRSEIKKIEDKFETSDFVLKTLGVGAVSGPCAYLASGKKGEMLQEKSKYNGITISIFQEETRKDG